MPNVPAGHAVHASEAGAVLYVPGVHAEQVDAELAPTVALAEPAGQSAHSLHPEVLLYVPAGQAVQFRALSENVPGAHAVHEVTFPGEM